MKLSTKDEQARLEWARKLYAAHKLPEYPKRLVRLMDRRGLTFTRGVQCLRWLTGQHRKAGRCDFFGLFDRPNSRCIAMHDDPDWRFDHCVFFHDEEGRRVVLTQPYYKYDFSDLCAEFGLTCVKLRVSPYSPETFAYLLSGPPGMDEAWRKAQREARCQEAMRAFDHLTACTAHLTIRPVGRRAWRHLTI